MDEYGQDNTEQGHDDQAWCYTRSQEVSCLIVFVFILYVMLMMKHSKDMPTTRSFTVRATESFFIYYDLVLIMS